jgi:hypothetical protein
LTGQGTCDPIHEAINAQYRIDDSNDISPPINEQEAQEEGHVMRMILPKPVDYLGVMAVRLTMRIGASTVISKLSFSWPMHFQRNVHR